MLHKSIIMRVLIIKHPLPGGPWSALGYRCKRWAHWAIIVLIGEGACRDDGPRLTQVPSLVTRSDTTHHLHLSKTVGFLEKLSIRFRQSDTLLSNRHDAGTPNIGRHVRRWRDSRSRLSLHFPSFDGYRQANTPASSCCGTSTGGLISISEGYVRFRRS
jgi:hypothetical protein